MNKPKEKAFPGFLEMTRHSWTYQKMTEEEKCRCEKALRSAPTQDIQGTYNQRWSAYNAVYDAYLIGIGYTGALWREPHPEEIPFIPGGDTE